MRQGDPLSPFLFIMCTEVLSRLLVRAEVNGILHGIKMSRTCPPLSHLLFANDLILFSKANSLDAEAIMQCLNTYGEWSGQSINRMKSKVQFSKNLNCSSATAICSTLGLGKSPSGG